MPFHVVCGPQKGRAANKVEAQKEENIPLSNHFISALKREDGAANKMDGQREVSDAHLNLLRGTATNGMEGKQMLLNGVMET